MLKRHTWWARCALSLAAALSLSMGGAAAAGAAPDDEQGMAVVSVLEEIAVEPVEEPILDVQGLIADAARRWQVDETVLLRIAWCESRWDPSARGPAGLAGLFQFAPITWEWVSVEVGFAGASPYDVLANAEAAAWLYKHEGPKHWGCK